MIRESADVTERDAPMITQNEAGREPAGPPMRVLETGVYRGPHLYGSLPMVRSARPSTLVSTSWRPGSPRSRSS